MHRILISGASGFIGSNLSSYLNNKEHFVSSISLRGNWKADPNHDVFIHLAGIEKDTRKVSDNHEYFKINSHLTLEFFQAFLNSDAKKFIFFSSCKSVLDSSINPISETTKTEPLTEYGKSKLHAENLIQEIELPYEKKLFILRPCLIHGPGDRGNLKQLFSLVSIGIPWLLGAFENKRSFCSIDNLMFILMELIEREDIPSGIYNVADDEPLSTNELIGLIAQSQNRKPKVWKISKSLIEKLARIGDSLHLPLNSERLHKLTSSYVVSNAKIKAVIGKPLPVSSKEGLMNTFQSFQNNK
jgi:nucleoside-diphosphate-sugar epimerase